MNAAVRSHIDTLISLVGVPYLELGRDRAGADCWGIVLMAGRELFDLRMPEYFYTAHDILPHACEHIRRETALPYWHAIEGEQAGAVHIFRIRGFEVHAAIDLGAGAFLHSLPGRNSCIELLRDANWVQRRVGTYVWTPQ